ncbi:MAG: dTDP-4-dehydrorhamnose reductase [Bryobacteraceae bacterium]|nr:dTDP-4-dehydrorhamnose reductase [Bryobacteraceae bacterium]
MQRKVVLFGSRGQLGVELDRAFRRRGYSVSGFDRQSVDVTDPTRIEHLIASLDPYLVVNATAYNMVDVAESEPLAAYSVNALAVRNLALACRQADCRLVHFSTDYVFDGRKRTPYTEDDLPHPLGAYGVSKLAGELYAQAYLDRVLIVRTSGVFGTGALHTARGNFIELMLRLAKSGQTIRVVEDHVASPTHAPALAERTADLVERNAAGVFHLAGGTAISWYHFAKLIFETFGLHPECRAVTEREYRTAARRPAYSALSNAKAEALGVAPMPSLAEAVSEYHAAREALVTAAG